MDENAKKPTPQAPEIGQITVRMNAVKKTIDNEFSNLYCKQDFEYRLQLAKTESSRNRSRLLRQLANNFKEIGIQCEYDESIEYYDKLLQTLQGCPTHDDLNKQIFDELYALYSQYPTPKDFMMRIVNNLDPDSASEGSLELRIFRRFLRTINVSANKTYYVASLKKTDPSTIGEKFFDQLNDPNVRNEKYYRMLQGSYQLANGKFLSPTSTKELLFLFAFAYDMRYYLSTEDSDYDVKRDVEKNLFHDYYCDNLTRYFNNTYKTNSGSSDVEPTGIALNPKSFVDVLFIYHLNSPGELPTPKKNAAPLSPQEKDFQKIASKVSAFYKSIQAVKLLWEEKNEFFIPEKKNDAENVHTQIYLNKINKNFFTMTVDELHQFIVDNYYCDFRYRPENNPDTIQTKGAFELQYLLNSPFKQYRYLLKLFKKELGLPKTATFEEMYDLLDHRSLLNDAHTETDENKKKFKTNSTLNKSVENKQWFDKKGSDALCVLSLSENTELLKAEDYIPIMGRSALDPDFIALMKHIEKRLEPEQVLCIENPSEITRTKLIAAYYHYACVVIGDDDTQTGLWKSFKDVYEEIDAELSDCLIESGFQPLSTKNLFDVFVVFLTYAKINGLLE